MTSSALRPMAATAGPLFVAFISIFLLRSVDLYGVAAAGVHAIAGVGLGGTLLTLAVGITTRLMNLGSVEASHALVAQDSQRLRLVLGALTLGSLLAAALLVLASVGVVLAGPSVGMDPNVTHTAAGYLIAAIVGGALQAFVLLSGTFVLSQVGLAKRFTAINAAGVVGHACGALLINVAGVEDSMLLGVAIGASYSAAALVMTLAMWLQLRSIPLMAGRAFDWEDGAILKALKLARTLAAEGIPIALARAGEAGLFAATMALVSAVDPRLAASFAVLLNAAMLLTMWPAALAQVVTNAIASVTGERGSDPHAVTEAAHAQLRSALQLTAGALVPLALAWGLADALDVGVCGQSVCLPNAVWVGLIYLLFVMADGAVSIHLGALRAIRDVRIPFVVLMFCYWALGYGGLLALSAMRTLQLDEVFGVLAFAMGTCALLLRRRTVSLYRARCSPGGSDLAI